MSKLTRPLGVGIFRGSVSGDNGNLSCVHVKLAYEPVSAELQCAVAGRVMNNNRNVEVKIEAEGAIWTSGWMRPKNGFFEVPVPLKERETTTFWVYAREPQGQLLEIDTPEFKVRHGLVISAPPLPHTLSIEVLKGTENVGLDPVFSKGTPLPAQKIIKYRATHALIPDNPGSDIAIKLWEGEYLDDPEANEWVGHVLISHENVQRRVPEGSEIELTIRIDESRRITVEAFVPHLNKHFTEHLYAPQREEQDFSNLSHSVVSETQSYRQRLETLERSMSGSSEVQGCQEEL